MKQILLVDKPKGMTSFDVIRVLRKKLGVRKMGHAGTLDPQASGLLIVAVGEATRELSQYLKLPKTYIADILLGISTDTGDMEGKTVDEKDASNISRTEVESALANMIGALKLPVPVYSAIKQGGEPLYKKARRGEEVDVPVKEMVISKACLLDFCINGQKVFVRVEFDVTSGTYIRSLAVEVGRRLALPATLSDLRRTRIGEFRVEDASAL